MASYTIDFETANNEDWSQTFLLQSDPSTAIPLDGATFAMQVRGAGDAPLIDASSANTLIQVIDTAGGVFGFQIPAASMAALAPSIYTHDMLFEQGGQTFQLWSGRLLITQGVTH